MVTYKDKTWCTFSECINFFPSRCERVMTDYDLKAIRDGNYLVSMFTDKPECFIHRNQGGM